MTVPLLDFQIRERPSGDSVRLTLMGELDLASAPELEDRLAALRARTLRCASICQGWTSSTASGYTS